MLKELESNFKITQSSVHCYVGNNQNHGNKNNFIHQSTYIKRIFQRFNMLDLKVKETSAD